MTSATPSCPSTVVVGGCSPPLPASIASVAETTPTFANNSHGAVQTSVGNMGSTSQQPQQKQQSHHYQHHHHHHYHQQQHHYQQQHYPQTAAAAAVTSSYPPPTTTPSSPSTSLGYSSGIPTTTQTVSVPRQLAQWTKHQTLKLQVLVEISIICSLLSLIESFGLFDRLFVDRLFRYSIAREWIAFFFRDGHSIAFVQNLREVRASRVDIRVRCERSSQGIQGGVA